MTRTVDGVLTLDTSHEATRLRALKLAVEWTCRHETPVAGESIVVIADIFRQYLANGTVPSTPKDDR